MDSGKLREQKRKACDSPAGNTRRKITRACDSCKEKKTRCTGTLPCQRCTKLSRVCEYTAVYTRGSPPSPLPAPGATPAEAARRDHGTSFKSSRLGRSRQNSRSIAVLSPRSSSPEPEATDLEGNYLGPSSGISFLTRVWRRLKQDDISMTPRIPGDETSKNTPVLMFGDRPFATEDDWRGLEMPPLERALKLVEIYFDFAIVTYRFLHRGIVDSLIRGIYEKKISPSNPPPGHWAAKAAIVFMVFAVSTLREEQHNGNGELYARNESERWYAAAKHMLSIETGPPTLETIEARLGLCLFLLSSSRANQCWYIFGTTMQLVTALGLHRRRPSKPSRGGAAYVEHELRKRVFWSAYTLDKYLSVMFGRPRLLDDEDIDQDLPDEVNDEAMFVEAPRKQMESTDCMMIASVLHYRLGHILGEISRRVYPTKTSSTVAPLEAAIDLTAELQKWKESVHPLFSSVRASSLIPPLRRQSHVLQLAYSHAMIHATRPFMLNDFTDLSRRLVVPHDLVTTHVQKCIDAAKNVMMMVDAFACQGLMLESFWFTHYVCFCAIIVAYIYTIQQHQSSNSPGASSSADEVQEIFNLAESCQQHLARATRRNCPSRRYSIILEELRLEVHRQIGSNVQPAVTRRPDEVPERIPEFNNNNNNKEDNQPSTMTSDVNYGPFLANLPAANLEANPDVGDDFNFLENLEGSAWWTQLDSWAYASIANEPSTLHF
ncbi:hypothetical protein VTN77DRAFT_6481 [Rasamsonia byssochlamydoides]|uniref:uncharacterized protein n=1 Tax=Rasamsonia byssochlamydoides TaxID=89139 RepID=UPI003743171D